MMSNNEFLIADGYRRENLLAESPWMPTAISSHSLPILFIFPVYPLSRFRLYKSRTPIVFSELFKDLINLAESTRTGAM